jgi:hypothetical protein
MSATWHESGQTTQRCWIAEQTLPPRRLPPNPGILRASRDEAQPRARPAESSLPPRLCSPRSWPICTDDGASFCAFLEAPLR